MSKLALRGLVLGTVIALLGVASYAIAGGGSEELQRTIALTGYEETPDISTVATGEFTARLNDDGTSLHYKLRYSGLEGTVTQAHVHFGRGAQRRHLVLPLRDRGQASPLRPARRPARRVGRSGPSRVSSTPTDVIGLATQGIEPGGPRQGDFAEILAAMRAGTRTRTSTRRSGPAARSAPSSTKARRRGDHDATRAEND